MTNKRLIRYCNIYWNMCETCEGCKYSSNYCDLFSKKTKFATPFMENKYHPEVYNDEELEVVNED